MKVVGRLGRETVSLVGVEIKGVGGDWSGVIGVCSGIDASLDGMDLSGVVGAFLFMIVSSFAASYNYCAYGGFFFLL